MLVFTLVEAKVASYRASRHEAKEAEIHNKWLHIKCRQCCVWWQA